MGLTPPVTTTCSLFLIAVLLNFGGAVVFLMLSLWFFESRRPFEPIFGHDFYTACVCVFVGCSSAACLLSVLGAAAVLAARRWQILLYASVTVLLGLAMGGTGIAAFLFHDQVRQIINVSLNQSMTNYYGVPGWGAVTSSIDILQDSMPCCGYILYNDWINADLYRYQRSRNGTATPLSCCRAEYRLDTNPRCNEGFPFPLSPGKLHNKGCLPLLESWYREHSYIIGAAASAISAFLLLSFCASMHHYREVSSRRNLQAALRDYKAKR